MQAVGSKRRRRGFVSCEEEGGRRGRGTPRVPSTPRGNVQYTWPFCHYVSHPLMNVWFS